MKKGDQVVFSRIGAYNMTQWMQFIRMRPKVVLIDMQKNVHVIRNNENTETLNALENVPEHLKTLNL
jgi:diaminopimelate decarboxylase